MSLFVKESDSIKIKYFIYFDVENNIVFPRNTEEELKAAFDRLKDILEKSNTELSLDSEKPEDKKELSIGMNVDYNKAFVHPIELLIRRPNHYDITTMLSESTRSIDGSLGVDIHAYNDLRLRRLLVDWSLKDESGNKIPITTKSLDDLNQLVYQTIIEQINAKIPLYL